MALFVLSSLFDQIALVVIFAIIAAASAQYLWSNGAYYGSPVVSSWPATGHWGGSYWNGAYSPYVSYYKK